MKVKLTIESRNGKTGKIPVSTSSKVTCPNACPLKGNGCYAEYHHANRIWQLITDGKIGDNWRSFLRKIREFPEGQLWRHNQAGDLPGANNKLDEKKCLELAKANEGKRGFTFCHYPVKGNLRVLRKMNRLGFTVNLSANNLEHADELAETGLPVAVVLPSDSGPTVTPAGRKVAVCPAITSDNITCKTCQLCQRQNRKVIVGFPAHGIGKRMVSLLAA
jgi:hypothetical protein